MTQVSRKGFVDKNGNKVVILPPPHTHEIEDINGLEDALASNRKFSTIVFTKSGTDYTEVSCKGEYLVEGDAEAFYGVMSQIINKEDEATKCKLVVEYNINETEVLGLLSYSLSEATVQGHYVKTHTYNIYVGSLLFTFEIVEEPQAGTFNAGEIHKYDLSSSL